MLSVRVVRMAKNTQGERKMNKEQQELYEKLLKKVNEYCLGYAAEDVIEAIDALVDNYENDSYVTRCTEALTILKKHLEPKLFQCGKLYLGITVGKFHASYEVSRKEWHLLKEIFSND